jgi:uncharacterized protein
MRIFDVQERVAGRVTIGSAKGETVILAGRMTERGNKEPIYFDASDNFVVLDVGKRGSGKSYGLASILEGFATANESAISHHSGDRRAVVLLDPLDVHWPALIPLTPDGPPALRAQHGLLRRWSGLQVEPVKVQVFVPAGHKWPVDHGGFRQYQLPVSEMTAADWALLLQADLVTEPRGRLLDETYRKATELGWQASRNGPVHSRRRDYGIADLIDCMENDHEIQGLYHGETLRSVIQALRSFQRMPLFEATAGTPMTEVAQPGVLSILCLGRLSEDLRTVVATVFVRKLKADRMYASQIRRRLALNVESEASRHALEEEVARHVPRTVLAIDEAQILMPARISSMARQALDSFVLEGRNFGLSLWLATQRPKGAISDAAISQIDTFLVHRLSVQEDIHAVCGMLQSRQPQMIRLDGRELDMAALIRSLDVGQAVFSSATSTAPRLVVGEIRPRMVAHGGESF